MKREKADLARRELIGLEAVVKSRHAGWDGLSGMIADETKHTFLVETASGSMLLVPKSGQEFVFRVGESGIAVRGEDIRFRPEDRTKKVRG